MTAKSTHLKLYTETLPEAAPEADAQAIQSLPKLFSAFEAATGSRLEVISHAGLDISDDYTWKIDLPTDPDRSAYLRVNPAGDDDSRTISDRGTKRLAKAIGETLAELGKTQVALRKREAELATGIPVVQHRDEEAHLAERLQAVLKGGLEAVRCVAAAVYLLDDATTQLKLRVSYGLPADRLTAPARPLADALADLEALLGHAVVMERRDISKRWNLPEDYASAVCVPISTPTTILGTLWFFCDESRDFDAHDTNLIEVVAGRIGADLEREVLMREGVDSMRLKNQLSAAERRQRNALPTPMPLYEGWETAGWVWNSESVGGDFYDWFPLPEKKLALAVGDTAEDGVEGAMGAVSLKNGPQEPRRLPVRYEVPLGSNQSYRLDRILRRSTGRPLLRHGPSRHRTHNILPLGRGKCTAIPSRRIAANPLLRRRADREEPRAAFQGEAGENEPRRRFGRLHFGLPGDPRLHRRSRRRKRDD